MGLYQLLGSRLGQQCVGLREADVNFIPGEECKMIKSTYDGYPYSLENKVFKTSLCATDFLDREDTCQGDSGGPILLHGQDAASNVQLGITSAGLGCAHPGVPAIYACVSYVYDWIQDFVCHASLNLPTDFDCDPPTAAFDLDCLGEMVNVSLYFIAK